MIVATAVGMSFFLEIILAGSVFVQRGIPSAEDARGIVPLILISTGVALAFGVVAYLLMPTSSQRGPSGEPVQPLSLSPGEVVVWTSSATGSLPFTVAVIGMCIVVAVLGVSGGPLYLLVVAALVAMLPLAFVMFHVSVGQRGLQVRSVLGWPRRLIDLTQITSVEVGAGMRLPSARLLADQLGINVHTVLKGYQMLRDEGLVELRRGRGAVVTDRADALAGLAVAADQLLDQARHAGVDVEGIISLLRARSKDFGDGRRPTGVESKHD